jgi:transcriptional regulator with XRE-family HTH domain
MAVGRHEPVVERRRLKVELKQARLRAEKTQRDVARAMDWSTSKLIRIESGEAKISRNDLKALLEYYGIDDRARVESLLEMARVAKEQESWSDYGSVMSPGSIRYLSFESSGAAIRSFQALVVPGLLQTEEYAHALWADSYGIPPAAAEKLWRARQRRQELHERETPPKMFFVIDEAAIRRPVGGTRVMRRQLVALQGFAGEPHVTLQILPFAVGAHPGLTARFVLVEFVDPNDDDVLYLEEPDAITRDDPKETGRYLERFFQLQEIAEPPERSVELLEDAIRGMEPKVG